MAKNKVYASFAEAVADVPDGSRAYFKGGYDPRYPGEFFIPRAAQSGVGD